MRHSVLVLLVLLVVMVPLQLRKLLLLPSSQHPCCGNSQQALRGPGASTLVQLRALRKLRTRRCCTFVPRCLHRAEAAAIRTLPMSHSAWGSAQAGCSSSCCVQHACRGFCRCGLILLLRHGWQRRTTGAAGVQNMPTACSAAVACSPCIPGWVSPPWTAASDTSGTASPACAAACPPCCCVRLADCSSNGITGSSCSGFGRTLLLCRAGLLLRVAIGFSHQPQKLA